MAETTERAKRTELLNRLDDLRHMLAEIPDKDRQALRHEIERVEQQLADLSIDQHNRSSMEGGSEA
ncbi:MAG: hypothetical protein J5J06_05715 [Phycisphaerae bacterium]|nr:hypothetical protein [Phycisphaerae bacterium]